MILESGVTVSFFFELLDDELFFAVWFICSIFNACDASNCLTLSLNSTIHRSYSRCC